MRNLPLKAENQVVQEQPPSTLAGSWDEILAQVAPVEEESKDDPWQQAVDRIQEDKAEDTLRGRRFQAQGE